MLRKLGGQIMSVDYIIGVSIFMLIFGICLFTWNNITYRIQEDYSMADLTNSVRRASDQLTRTPGVPETWENNPSSAKSIGLAVGDRILSESKINGLSSMGNETLRRYLGVGSHQVYIRLSDENRGLIAEAGVTPSGNMVASARRIAVMNNHTVFLDVSVWDTGVINVMPPVQ